MDLLSILEEQILFEGRKEEVMENYPELDPAVIQAFIELDPSGTNKYLEWATKSYYGAAGNDFIEEYVNTLMGYIIKYHEKQDLITPTNVEDFFGGEDRSSFSTREVTKIKAKPKDINSFENPKTFALFIDFIDSIKSKRKELSEIKKESDRVYEDERIVVVSPRTHRSSCHYGKHSTWCVATSNATYYGNYTKEGTLYFFLSKKDEEITPYWGEATNGREHGSREGGQPAHTPPFKTALLIKDDGNISWWSKNDSNYANSDLANLSAGGWVGDSKLPFLTEEMAQKVLSYSRFALENRMQREIEALLKSKGFYESNRGDKDNFQKLVKSNVLKPEQLLTIIKNDNWTILYENSDVNNIIRQTIGNDNVFSLTKDFLKSKIPIGEILKYMSENKFLSSYESFSEEQSREITSIILEKLGSKPTKDVHGLDVKVFIDKWTMNPEEWKKYSSFTNYIFIGDLKGKNPKLIIDKSSGEYFTKIDRFKVGDFDKIEKAQMQSKFITQTLYGIVTEKNLLDQYINNIEYMSKEVMAKIMEKAKVLYQPK